MAKVKVRVLYATAFQALGIEEPRDEESIEQGDADALIAIGYAEELKAKAPPRAVK